VSDILSAPLDPRECERRVLTPADGALVTFTGAVRDHHAGRAVRALRYEAHPEADRFLQQVLDRHRTGEIRIAAQHRIGELAIGDLAVVVAVAAPHRGAAFTVCELVIDEIKSQVPIWKYETYADGDTAWVAACTDH
jgi:molybdopterin synthase catalytic subunit